MLIVKLIFRNQMRSERDIFFFSSSRMGENKQ